MFLSTAFGRKCPKNSASLEKCLLSTAFGRKPCVCGGCLPVLCLLALFGRYGPCSCFVAGSLAAACLYFPLRLRFCGLVLVPASVLVLGGCLPSFAFLLCFCNLVLVAGSLPWCWAAPACTLRFGFVRAVWWWRSSGRALVLSQWNKCDPCVSSLI